MWVEASGERFFARAARYALHSLHASVGARRRALEVPVIILSGL